MSAPVPNPDNSSFPDQSTYDPLSSGAQNDVATRDISACMITLPITLLATISDVQVYGQTVSSSVKLVECHTKLPVSALVAIDASDNEVAEGSAIQFQQDISDANEVTVEVPSTFDDTESGPFASGVDTALSGPVRLNSLDTATFLWWDEAGRSLKNDPNFEDEGGPLYNYASFYKFVLAQVAYDVFKHPLAQAGIANDTAIEDDLKPGSANAAGSLGKRLAEALKALSAAQLKAVYQQMVAQDPSRFNLEDAAVGPTTAPTDPNWDNNASAAPPPRALPFQIGDVIRFEIALDDYTVKRVPLNSGPNAAAQVSDANRTTDLQTSSGQTITSNFSGQAINDNGDGTIGTVQGGTTYTVQMTLGDRV